MNLPIFVCPLEPALLRRLAGVAVAVRVDRAARIADAVAAAKDSGNALSCVILESACPLDEIAFGDDLKDTPLAVRAPSAGKFRNLAGHLDRLKRLNLRVHLPCDRAENITGLRILSSVGIRGCAVIGNGSPDWDALADLMIYAILEPVPHASIEPFAAIAAGYDPEAWLEWGGVEFEDPRRFLHMDRQGRIALSSSELEESKFIAQEISELPGDAEHPAVRERLDARRRMFAENYPCASCAGWKVCLGKFAAAAAKDRGCEALFVETMDAALRRRAAKRRDRERTSDEY